MSKLDDILKDNFDLGFITIDASLAKQQIKDMLQALIDETFDAKDEKAYEFWQKVESL